MWMKLKQSPKTFTPMFVIDGSACLGYETQLDFMNQFKFIILRCNNFMFVFPILVLHQSGFDDVNQLGLFDVLHCNLPWYMVVYWNEVTRIKPWYRFRVLFYWIRTWTDCKNDGVRKIQIR